MKVTGGDLSSATSTQVLNGANAMAIGDGSSGRWEVFQFATAQVVAPDTYDLSVRLRGQLGTDGIAPDTWPPGSIVVALDLTLVQLDLPASSRGLERYFRIGAAARGYEDSNTVLATEAFDGIGLRPYSVSHLKGVVSGGDIVVTWIRRTRIDGDSWQSSDVPLGEESERYTVRIIQGSVILAEYSVTSPTFAYTSAMRTADGVSGPFSVSVAQVSASFGAGPFRAIDLAA